MWGGRLWPPTPTSPSENQIKKSHSPFSVEQVDNTYQSILHLTVEQVDNTRSLSNSNLTVEQVDNTRSLSNSNLTVEQADKTHQSTHYTTTRQRRTVRTTFYLILFRFCDHEKQKGHSRTVRTVKIARATLGLILRASHKHGGQSKWVDPFNRSYFDSATTKNKKDILYGQDCQDG